MTAKADRDECDKALRVKFMKDMTVENFQVSFTNALDDYNSCSTVSKFADTPEGVEEQVEFLLQLLGDGALKTTVALKFDKLRSESEVDHTERPGIDKFWEVLTRIHGIQEHQRMRSTTSVNQNKRSRDETVNTSTLVQGAFTSSPSPPRSGDTQLKSHCTQNWTGRPQGAVIAVEY